MRLSEDNLSDVMKQIALAFSDLKHSAADFHQIVHDLDLHGLEVEVTSNIARQAEKEGLQNAGAKSAFSVRRRPFAESAAEILKNKQSEQFRHLYFDWAAGLLKSLQKAKIKNDWRWLDLDSIAKQLGSLEFN